MTVTVSISIGTVPKTGTQEEKYVFDEFCLAEPGCTSFE
jgi:hypothetical protein